MMTIGMTDGATNKKNVKHRRERMNADENNQAELEQQEQEMSEKLNIHQRILAVMGQIAYIQKGDKKVNNQYTFIGHDAVTAALHPLMVKHGITCLTSVESHSQDGNRTEASISLMFTNVDKPEDFVTVNGFGHGIDPQDKGAGKAVSYAVKMLLLKTFMLETGDRDNEADATNHIDQNSVGMVAKIREAEQTGDWVALSMMARTEEWINAWGSLDSHVKGKINKLNVKAGQYRDGLNQAAENDDAVYAAELWDELEKDGKQCVWPMLGENTQSFIAKLKEEK